MSNIKHYIEKIQSGDAFFTVKMKMQFIVILLGLFEIIPTVLFYVTGITPLIFFHAVLIPFYYVIVLNILKKERYALATILCIFIIIVNSFTTTLCIGTESGFSMYLFAAVVACFYLTFIIESFQKREAIPVFISLFLMCCYIFNIVMMKFVPPLYTFDKPGWNITFNLINCSISFIVIIFFNVMFVWEVKARNNLLSSKNIQLDELAHKDPLTHLLNRRSMNEHLMKSIETLKLTGKRFCLVLCDIDDFKHVNDTYGHDAGDAVLVAVSNIVSSAVRDSDVVCRWGGEEILILISDPIETASICAERIRKKISDNITQFGGYDIRVTMTFGISESIPGYKIEQLIQQADDKLYKGKKSGKNCVIV